MGFPWVLQFPPIDQKKVRLSGDSKLPVDINMSVNGCLSLCVSPVIHWRHVQGVSCLSANVCWYWLQPPVALERISTIDTELLGICQADVGGVYSFVCFLTVGGGAWIQLNWPFNYKKKKKKVKHYFWAAKAVANNVCIVGKNNISICINITYQHKSMWLCEGQKWTNNYT